MTSQSKSKGALLAIGFVVLGAVGNLLAVRAFLPAAPLSGAGSAQAPPALRGRSPGESAPVDGVQDAVGLPSMFASAVAVGLLLSLAGGSQPVLAEEQAPIGEMVGVEYSGKEAKGASGVIRKKVRGEKKQSAKAAPAATTASDGSSAAAPAASAPVKAAEALPRPGQGSFDKNGDFVLPAGPRDPMIPISEDNTPRRENSPVHTTFFETGQDPTERRIKLFLVLFGPGFVYLFFFITGSLGIL